MSAALLCVLLVIALGCASSIPKPGQIGGPPGETRMDPEAIEQKDLPPPEKPPVEIRARVEHDPQTGTYTYIYTVSNGTPYRITDFHIGLEANKGSNALRVPPLGLSDGGRMPPDRYGAPSGWTLLYEGGSQSLGSMTWTAQKGDAILPGESLTGFRVEVAKRDKNYERSHWFAIVTGEPGTHAGALETKGDPIPAGDSVDRLGRLSIFPRISRGPVSIRYHTPKKARPIVSILDSRGEVVRRYDQDRRRVGVREIVWDRRDTAGDEVPVGDYFVRVRYGFTERFGRVTLVH